MITAILVKSSHGAHFKFEPRPAAGPQPHELAMIRNLFRDLLGSPLDPTERSAMFINDESNLRQRIVEYEKRMCEMKEIAARQAQDIQDLRQVNDTSIEKAVEASSADLTSPLGLHILTSPNGSRRSPASGSERWRSALQEATEQQQQATEQQQWDADNYNSRGSYLPPDEEGGYVYRI